MIWLRSAAFNVAFFVFTAGVVLTGVPLLALPPRYMAAWVRQWSRGLRWLMRVIVGIHVRVTGRENMPDGPCIVASKHQSAFDTFIWLELVPRPAYVMKVELMRIPLWGLLARHAGHIVVDRSAAAAAMRGLIREGKAAAASGHQIVIFPEGTRSAPGERLPYQPGVVALASATKLPVVPVATDSGRLWPRRSFRKLPGTLTIAILPPLPDGLPRATLLPALEAVVEGESTRLLAAAMESCG